MLLNAGAKTASQRVATKLEVVANAQCGENVALLRHEAQTGITRRQSVTARKGVRPEADGARLRLEQPGDQLEQRALAGPVGSDDDRQFARVNFNVDALHDLLGGGVTAANSLYVQRGHSLIPK